MPSLMALFIKLCLKCTVEEGLNLYWCRNRNYLSFGMLVLNVWYFVLNAGYQMPFIETLPKRRKTCLIQLIVERKIPVWLKNFAFFNHCSLPP